ncbi:MAG TPA: hypothetical protein VG839_01460, partial [Asticcacaulis sp.]|nr:hypothetical protein [Asticcacaulis sp.]
GTGAETATGWADRYGGQGIGACGGSARAAFVNGYHVKGIGKTPLLSARNDEAHSTGCVSLDEAIRETIFSEKMSQFPWSVVPNLAILTTGLDFGADMPPGLSGSEGGGKVLVVRPAFLRPAHFERAVAAVLPDIKTGEKDAARVVHMIKGLLALTGQESLRDVFLRFWARWAEQLAYGLVNRLSQHAHSTSNICLSGQLIDFGAARSFSSNRSIRIRPGALPHGADLDAVMRSVNLTTESLSWYGGELDIEDRDKKEIIRVYNRKFIESILSLTNLQRDIKAFIFSDKTLEMITQSALQCGEFKNYIKRAFLNLSEHKSGPNTDQEDAYNVNIERAIKALFSREELKSLISATDIDKLKISGRYDIESLSFLSVRTKVRDMLSATDFLLDGQSIKDFIEGELS